MTDIAAILRAPRQAGRVLAGAIALALAACNATDPNAPGRSAAAAVGFATTYGEPKDFVLARRSNAPLDYVPVGRGGVERPVQPRSVAGVRDFERDLDRVRDQSTAFARRQLPAGAYGQPLPSVAAPPRPAGRAAQPDPNAPTSYPVSASRARQLRDNARAVQEPR